MWNEVLRCPVCGAAVKKEENSLFCEGARRHCFDFSADGYVNLTPAHAAGGGDDATLIAARTAFLRGGYYQPLADRVCEILRSYVPKGVVLDAGCGEGYYTNRIAAAGYPVFGFDLSKRGIRTAARAAKREGQSAHFAVAGIYDLPVADERADAVVSLFAPVAEAEFCRVLKKDGVLVVVGAGAEHLFSLKRVLYDVPRKNEPRADLPRGMQRLHAETLRFEMQLDAPAIAALFAMTPYYYRTAKEASARLLALSALSCEAEMDIAVFKKM